MMKVNTGVISNSLAVGSKKRLMGFINNLTRDTSRVIFDDKLVDVALKYARNPLEVEKVRATLNSLRNEDGEPFCQSIYHYSKLREQINGFVGKNYTSFRWNAHYQEAIKDLTEIFSKAHLTSLSYHDDCDVADALPKKDTHSGWTYIETGLKEKGENTEGLYSRLIEAEKEAVQQGTFNRPILPGRRIQGTAYEENGQLREYAKLKNRVVNMVDLIVICSENRYAHPIQEWMSKWSYYAGGKSQAEISTIIFNDRRDYPYFISLDYSAFDQTLSNWLIEDAFSILKSAFNEVDEDLWNVLVHDFIYKTMITAEGPIKLERGVPSGSMFTQIIDSICNVLMILTYAKSQAFNCHMIVMGDDNLMFSDVEVTPDSIASYVSKNFGVKVNSDKTSSGTRNEYPHFLSREWRLSGQWRHPNVILAKMMFPERFRNYNDQVTPELVFYAYALTYPLGMNELFDMQRFYLDNPKLNASLDVSKVGSRYIPGALSYAKEYLGAS